MMRLPSGFSRGEIVERARRAVTRGAIHTSRLALAAVCSMSAAYLLLCSVPFSNQALIQTEMIAWLPVFAVLQPYVFVLAAAAVVASTLPRFGFGRSIVWSGLLAALLGAFALWLIVASPLGRAASEPVTLLWASWMFVPLVLVGCVDVADGAQRIIWRSSRGAESARQFRTLLGAAICVTLVFFTVGIVRAPRGTLGGGEFIAIGLVGFWTQLVVAVCAFCGLMLVRSIAAFFYRSAYVEALLLCVLGAAGLSWGIVSIVFEPLSVGGFEAWMFALVASGSLAVLVYGTGIRHRALDPNAAIGSGVDLVVAGMGLTPGVSRRLLAFVGGGAVVAVVAAAFVLADHDWNFVQQKLLVVAAWVIVSAILYRAVSGREPAPDATIVWLEFCALIVGGHYALDRWGGRIPSLAGGGDFVTADGRWRGWDAAYQLGRDAVGLEAPRRAGELYAFLKSHANVPRSSEVTPVEITHAKASEPLPAARPHVFVFVIDSLRRDYVGAIDRKVNFTPSIDALAREGVSFRNAFSRYGGTGLAAPSIWAGGLLLHKQYVQPFLPMNSLQKLLAKENYLEFLSSDPLLEAVVPGGPRLTRLPGGGDFCGQLAQLETRITALPPGAGPLFAYLQPLDLHVSSIRREDAGVPPGESYPGFHAPYAWRVRRLDRCLGKFFDALRRNGMWDRSMVVVTADHGDALAETGQWGHAYSIAPEILRVPLVVKLPKSFQAKLKADRDAIAFTTDVTPTIHYVLGYRPIVDDDLLGRPLFTEELSEQKPYIRGDYLVASSYGPVWGLVGENGRKLYVSDAISARDTVFEIPADGPPVQRAPYPGEARRAHALLRQKIQALADRYRFKP